MTDSRRRPLLGSVAVAILVLAAVAQLVASARPEWDPRPDAARYLSCARSLVRGEGYTYLGQPFTLRPPGWSLILAPVTAAVGLDFRALEIFTGLAGLAATLAFWFLFYPRLGPWISGAAAIWLWTHPERIGLCRQIMADVPGLAALIVAVIAVEAAARRPSRGRAIGAGVAIAGALYLRTAHLALLPALVLGWIAGGGRNRGGEGADSPRGLRRWRPDARLLVPLAVALVLYLPWAAYSARVGSTNEPGGIDFDSYWETVAREDPIDAHSTSLGLQGWLDRIADNAAFYGALAGSDLRSTRLTGVSALVSLLLVAGWLATLARRRGTLEWVVGLELAVLLVYFALHSRLLFPPFVLLVGLAAEAGRELARRLAGRRVADVLLAGALLWGAVAHLGPGPAWVARRPGYEDLAQLARYLEASTTSTQILAGDHGAIYGLLADRRVLSLQAMLRRRPAMLQGALDRYAVDVAIAEHHGLLERLLGELPVAARPVASFGRYRVFHIDRAGPGGSPTPAPPAAAVPDSGTAGPREPAR